MNDITGFQKAIIKKWIVLFGDSPEGRATIKELTKPIEWVTDEELNKLKYELLNITLN